MCVRVVHSIMIDNVDGEIDILYKRSRVGTIATH